MYMYMHLFIYSCTDVVVRYVNPSQFNSFNAVQSILWFNSTCRHRQSAPSRRAHRFPASLSTGRVESIGLNLIELLN